MLTVPAILFVVLTFDAYPLHVQELQLLGTSLQYEILIIGFTQWIPQQYTNLILNLVVNIWQKPIPVNACSIEGTTNNYIIR